MAIPLSQRISDQVTTAAGLYHRLILVVGPPRTGKSTALRELADEQSWPLVNVNLSLSERLLELTSRQRALKVPRLLDQMLEQHVSDVLILDNTEVFVDLRVDPYLCQRRGQHRRRPGVVVGDAAAEDDVAHRGPANPVIRCRARPLAVEGSWRRRR